jgi:hypothetical protein
MKSAVYNFIFFMIFEFLIFFFVFVITGAASVDGQPLQLVQDIATSISTSVWAIGIGFFILATFANLALLFLSIARTAG